MMQPESNPVSHEIVLEDRTHYMQGCKRVSSLLTLMGEKLTNCLLALALTALALSACEQTPQRDGRNTIWIVAVAPFSVAQSLRDQPQRFGNSSPEAASRLVTRQVSETLRERGVKVIAAEEVRRSLGAAGVPIRAESGSAMAPDLARVVADKFGANALLVGRITRWDARQGSAAAAIRGASVTFDVALFNAPGGRQLWSTSFSHTQQPLSENVLAASRLPGRGTRWLSAEELALWGAERTARQVPLD